MRVKCLAQEHNAVPRPRLGPGLLDPKFSALTIRLPRLPLQIYRSFNVLPKWLESQQTIDAFSVKEVSFKIIVSLSFTSEIQNWQSVFFWDHNVISLTIRSFSRFSNLWQHQQVRVQNSVLTLLWIQVSSKKMDLLTKTLAITKIRKNKSQFEDKSPF